MILISPPEVGRPYAVALASDGETLDALPDGTVEMLFREHGAVLVRGFEIDLERFRWFAGRFCTASVFNESPDRRTLNETHNIQSVNGGTAPFPLHPELSREPWKPDACFFCCLSPPTEGGRTTICDGTEIVRQLPDSLRVALSALRLEYRQPATPEVLEFWLGTAFPSDARLAAPPPACPYRFTRTETGIDRRFTRPVLHRPLFTEAQAWGNFLLFARYLLGRRDFPTLEDGRSFPDVWLQIVKRVSDNLTVPIDWERGDVLMLDNSRFMHGRTAIENASERLIASFFGYLRDAPVDPEAPADPLWRRDHFRPPVAAPTSA